MNLTKIHNITDTRLSESVSRNMLYTFKETGVKKSEM